MVPDTNSWCSLGFAELSAAYTSATQQARHLTEGWMAEHGFCPACPADRLPPPHRSFSPWGRRWAAQPLG